MSDRQEPSDHFSRFGLPQRFAVDEQLLTKRYYDLQWQNHPDRFVNATDEQQQWAVQQAAAINQAFHTLKDPLRRAEYLLMLQGLGDQEEHRHHDTAFLMEQLALGEALATATDQAVIAELAARIAALNNDYYQRLIDCLENAAWKQAAESLSQLKFLAKHQQQLLQLELADPTR
ncbi:Fe-S protein assembly co-chaperone HscB [unidentified bacterial endosymbiont]|uniref:Fe-S protein assembly co-chaperone HscB n=1 Tax=unidentified bacterial endosymbiont TaxID=2355 RepID=UPI00209EF6A5|nr:Fe-S protein assembly co-chaperone HscB [unidentified bacterial endosymbiont]